jgi:Helix-turn-helix domain
LIALVGGEGAVFSREFPMGVEQSPINCDQFSAATPSPKRLFDPREASAYLRIAKQTLARWRCYGLGPRFVRIGGRIFYDIADLDAFIAGNKFRSTAEADQAAVT